MVYGQTFDVLAETLAGLHGGANAVVNGRRVSRQQHAVFAVRHTGRVHAGQNGRADFHAETAVQQGTERDFAVFIDKRKGKATHTRMHLLGVSGLEVWRTEQGHGHDDFVAGFVVSHFRIFRHQIVQPSRTKHDRFKSTWVCFR